MAKNRPIKTSVSVFFSLLLNYTFTTCNTLIKNLRIVSPQKDLELERCVGKWLEMVAGKRGKDETFERWIQDGTVLAKVGE